jgi:prolycopene isomerase
MHHDDRLPPGGTVPGKAVEGRAVADQYDAIVVGAGFGGAASAALLAKNGLKTLLLDKNAQPGGKAVTIAKEGFRYELWPIVGGPSLNSQFASVLEEIDMADEVELLTPETPTSSLLYKGRSGGYEELIGSARPREQADAAGLISWLQLDPADLPELTRLLHEMSTLTPQEIDALDDITLAEFLSRYRLPESVHSFFGMQCNILFVAPIDLVAASEAIKTFNDFGAGGAMRYSAGGYGRVAEVFAQAVQKYGGDLRLRTGVTKIAVAEGSVTGVATEAGSFAAPIVLSNAGLQPTVLKLVGEEHFDRSYVNYIRGLLPSWGLMGIRYFLSEPVFQYPVSIAFSDESYWDAERFRRIKAGEMPDELLVFNVVPSLYDPSLAPEGKQCALVATLCSPDPEPADSEVWWSKLDEMVDRLWPEMRPHVEREERYSPAHVSSLSRDHVLPGQGGECIGLAQIVGQCGRHKPSAKAPIRGLYYVGCDAGGYGCGTHQAVDSGVEVARMVLRDYRITQGMSSP